MKNIKYILAAFVMIILTTACDDFLEVNPDDQVLEADQFLNETGFYEVLNGVYLAMGETSHYGSSTTFNELDIMAQYYTISLPAEDNYDLSRYDYTSSKGINLTNGIWGNAYAEIANLNNLLDQLNSANPAMFNDDNFNLIKGEALALRAYLHFDIYRLYAPNVKVDGQFTLPYVEMLSTVPTKHIAATAFLTKAMADLEAASKLMEDIDPVINNPTAKFNISRNNTEGLYRINHLNFYAVRAMMARIESNRGNDAEAFALATEVIDTQMFNFVTLSDIDGGIFPTDGKNLLFYDEILFGIHQQNLHTIQEPYFGISPQSSNSLRIDGSVLDAVFEMAGTDLRRNNLFINNAATGLPVLVKYRDFSDDVANHINYDPMLPVLKISEMYLIAAQSAPDDATAEGYVNQLKFARQITELAPGSPAVDIETAITQEYKKEMYGDGQLFYYYKKNNMTPEYGNTPVDPFNSAMFVLPMPDNEIELGNG